MIMIIAKICLQYIDNILPSPKVRDLGVIFDECLTLDAHISNICRRAH